jgi:hypothetical protein
MPTAESMAIRSPSVAFFRFGTDSSPQIWNWLPTLRSAASDHDGLSGEGAWLIVKPITR